MTAVTNSGPLIALAKLNHLRLLPAMYGEVIVPQAVIDEDHARAIADQLGLVHIGTLGILTGALRRELLSADALDDLLISIESRDDIWIHPDLCGRVRREVLGR